MTPRITPRLPPERPSLLPALDSARAPRGFGRARDAGSARRVRRSLRGFGGFGRELRLGVRDAPVGARRKNVARGGRRRRGEGTLDAADARELSVVCWSLATAAWDPSEAAWRAIDRGVERSVASERGGRATPQAVANILWATPRSDARRSARGAGAGDARNRRRRGGRRVTKSPSPRRRERALVVRRPRARAGRRRARGARVRGAAARARDDPPRRRQRRVGPGDARGRRGRRGGRTGRGTPARASTLDALDLAEVRLAPSMTAAEIGSAMVSRATRRKGRASASASASAGAARARPGEARREPTSRRGRERDEAWWRAVETAIARTFSDDRPTTEDSGSDSAGRSARSKPVADALWAYAAPPAADPARTLARRWTSR